MNKKIKIIILFLLLSLFIPIYAEEDVSPEVDSSYEENYEEIESTESSYFYQNENTKYKAFIDDGANLLTEEEKQKLFDTMIPLTDYGHIAFVSISTNYSSVDSFAEQYYHSNFSTESGSIFVIDMDNRKIYIFSDGDNYRLITRSKALSITDNTYQYASREDYYQCANIAFSQMNAILNGQKIAEPMRFASNIFIALTLAFLFAFLFILVKSKTKKVSNSDIVNNCDIAFQLGAVNAVKNGSHRVYSPVSDSSSSGGSSGGGGGGSSGGGGGHSF